jgi:hypothetical protein
VTRRPGDRADRGVPAAQVIPVPLIEGENALDPGVDPVGSVDVGKLAAPAADLAGQVGHPQGVPPAVFGLEQGQLRAGAGPLAAGEDPHLLGPSVELVPSGAVAQQAGQLGDVRFFDPAPADSRGQGAGGGAGAPVHHHVASPADPDGAARFGVLGRTTVEGGVAHPGQVQQLANVGSLVRREAQREPQRFVRADWPGTVAGGSIRVDACWQGSLFVASVGCSRDEVATGDRRGRRANPCMVGSSLPRSTCWRWPLRPEAKYRRRLPAPQHAWPAADRPCVSLGVHRCRWRLSLTSSLGRLRAGRERLLSPTRFPSLWVGVWTRPPGSVTSGGVRQGGGTNPAERA